MACADQPELVRKLRQTVVDRCRDRLAAKLLKPREEREGQVDPATHGIGRHLRQLRGM
ncbi:MAG: hypothetical protein MUC66_02320 [Methanolinea sp.]|jgi:hypothetical protein|nr:hypothetical protein [Methanolinea sp.]